jgi:hypothetical protein
MRPQGHIRPIKSDKFAELAWKVLFQRGKCVPNRYASSSQNAYSWVYEDALLHIEDFESREWLTVRYSHSDTLDAKVLLSKNRGHWECFVPEERVIAHLERLQVLDTLANL